MVRTFFFPSTPSSPRPRALSACSPNRTWPPPAALVAATPAPPRLASYALTPAPPWLALERRARAGLRHGRTALALAAAALGPAAPASHMAAASPSPGRVAQVRPLPRSAVCWRKKEMFFILAPIYVSKITNESISELELYQMVWWKLSSTVELFHGGALALERCF